MPGSPLVKSRAREPPLDHLRVTKRNLAARGANTLGDVSERGPKTRFGVEDTRMRTVTMIVLSAVLLAGCGVLPPDNSDQVSITRTVPSGG